tara:strand:+ start:218 stop:430 length:213 start_codon:yes stop_codon:yes gene_type:complete
MLNIWGNKVDILNLLTKLSKNMLDQDALNTLIKSQPDDIRDAIETNDSNKLKLCISNKKIYANEVKVTTY